MGAATINLEIEQGATFRQKFTYSAGTPPAPVNLTGCKGRMPAVQSYIDAITDPEESVWASLAMNDAAVWRRYDSHFLLKAAVALGLTSEQLDELFIAASKIVI